MKKIISILIALGLVLSLTVMATPVAAKVTGVTAKVFDTNCACSIGTYNITFNITASLTQGVHCICVAFPAGTTVPATGSAWKNGDIMIYTATQTLSVFGGEVWVDGTTVCFLPPADIVPATDNPILVQFTAPAAGIINPCTAGKYQLEVYTCREPDATPVKSNKYTIVPCISEYVFVMDFSPTYPGIAKGFVPPFKACGQNSTGKDYITTQNGTRWDSGFNLTFEADPIGCHAACSSVDIYMSLVAAPQYPCEVDPAANVTMKLDGIWYTLTFNECVDDEPTETKIDSISPLLANTTVTWEGMLHFDTVGEYTICFWAVCPGLAGAPCQPPTSPEGAILVETCFVFKVYQWKEADVITLREKWNLISLPLVPLEEGIPIDDVLASIPAADLATILSIWHYDRCADEWFVWGNGQSSLTTLEDGKGYWVRAAYPLPLCGNITWWVWGTILPVPPASPAEYAVCEGWNMVGVIGYLWTEPQHYLWNWAAGPHPVVYGWTQGCWDVQTWSLIPWSGGPPYMDSGQGYWIAFPADGAIYVP